MQLTMICVEKNGFNSLRIFDEKLAKIMGNDN